MIISSYKDLIVWQKGIDLVKEVYIVTKKFPPSEIYGLASQMQRAAVSVPSNIAEGNQRKNTKEYIQFLYTALGSLAELDTQIIIAKNLYMNLDYSKVENFLLEIQKMLNTIIKKLLT